MNSAPQGTERHDESRKEALKALLDDVDPMKFAGEGHFATEEYFPQDIRDPHVLGDLLGQDEYYPPPVRPPKKWPPSRRS